MERVNVEDINKRCKSLSVTCGDSSHKGRAKICVLLHRTLAWFMDCAFIQYSFLFRLDIRKQFCSVFQQNVIKLIQNNG